MSGKETLTTGKWRETESTHKRAEKIYAPVLEFLKQLQKENEEDDGN